MVFIFNHDGEAFELPLVRTFTYVRCESEVISQVLTVEGDKYYCEFGKDKCTFRPVDSCSIIEVVTHGLNLLGDEEVRTKLATDVIRAVLISL